MKQKLWIAVSVFGLGLIIGLATSSSQAEEPAQEAPQAQVAPHPNPNIPLYVRDAHGRLIPNPELTHALQESIEEEEELAAEAEEDPQPQPAPNPPALRPRLEPLAPLPTRERREARREERRVRRHRGENGGGFQVTF